MGVDEEPQRWQPTVAYTLAKLRQVTVSCQPANSDPPPPQKKKQQTQVVFPGGLFVYDFGNASLIFQK